MESGGTTPLDLGPEHFDVEYAEESLPPEDPSLSPSDWMKKNLFSSPASAVLTIVFGALAIFAIRGLLAFVLGEERQWDAIATNIRLMAAQGYPLDQFVRIWVALGSLISMAGLSAAIFRASGRISLKRISIWIMNIGVAFAVLAILAPFTSSGRVGWLIAGAVVGGIGAAIWFGFGEERRRSTFFPSIWVFSGFFAVGVLALWVVPFGHYFLGEDGRATVEPGTVAFSTQMPWTVMLLLLVGSYLLGLAARDHLPQQATKGFLGLLWVIAPFVLNWIVLRDPDFDYDHVFSTDIPMALGFIVIGGALLWAQSSATIGETGRLLAIGVLLAAVYTWVSRIEFLDFLPNWSMLQKARLSMLFLGLYGLAANNFSRDNATRRAYIAGWVVFMVLFHWLVTAVNSPSTLNIQKDTYLGGLTLTIFIAWLTLLVSFPIGVVMALGRTSSLPIFRLLSTGYIEMIRGVPLITILFFFANILNFFLPEGMEMVKIAAVVVGYGLFSAAYLAENVRGGLQSIRRGQFEAADALGLTTAQRTSFIVLPQALRVSIPPLVGQSIATFKETALVAIIGLNDFLRIANNTIPSQTDFVGAKREGLLVVSAVYFVVAFSMSKYSQRLEKKLGLGTR